MLGLLNLNYMPARFVGWRYMDSNYYNFYSYDGFYQPGSNLQHKPKGGAPPKPVKRKAPSSKVVAGSSQHKFDHPHLLATLKGHTAPLTGGDFSSNGKQFITSSEVAKACPYVIPGVEDKDCNMKNYKALNHNEDDANMWTPTSLSSCSTTPSDTEDSLTSSSSCSSKMSRRQKKNKKRKKANSLVWENNNNNKPTKANKNENSAISKSEDIQIESVVNSTKSKRCKSPVKSGKNNKTWGYKSDGEMHKRLLPYCVEVEHRILSGYPYQTYRGTYVFKSFGFSRLETILGNHRLVDAEIKDKLSSDLSDDDSSSENFMENSSGFDDNFRGDGNFKKCERCRQYFDVNGNGRTLCHFHPNKAVLTIEGSLRYTCCNSLKNDGGCQSCNYHVFHHLTLGINGPLNGYVSTRPMDRPPQVFGLDCEMVFTTHGFEVARATVVNEFGESMIDSFVIPEGDVLDYNTQFSGVTEQKLVDAVPFKVIQEGILNLVSSCDILVGHSLEGDLVVLKLLHRRVVDSSLLFSSSSIECNVPGASPIPRRQGLKSLVKEHLGEDIQMEGASGHDSLVDARASLNLVISKVSNESCLKTKHRKSKIAPVPPILHAITA